MNVDLKTSVEGTKIIQEALHSQCSMDDPLGQLQHSMSKWICETRNVEIRKALIKLGWTPPDDTKKDDCCEKWKNRMKTYYTQPAFAGDIGPRKLFCPECGRNLAGR